MDAMSDQGIPCAEFVADCRVRAVTELFAHTWDPVVLAALRPGPRRRHELRTMIGGVSDKVLTDALHRLVRHGLIRRQRNAQAPPRVDYCLTPLGESLLDGPMRALGDWVIEHGDELLDAQDREPDRLPLAPSQTDSGRRAHPSG